MQFMMKCEGLDRVCDEHEDVSRPAFCALTSAYIHLCHRNYVPLELPVQCGQYSCKHSEIYNHHLNRQPLGLHGLVKKYILKNHIVISLTNIVVLI